jgi:hypothetical protein
MLAIFYTDANYRCREVDLEKNLYSIGFDEVIPYRREWLEKTDFYKENKSTLDMKRGGGYCLWKPYIILETLKNIGLGEVVFYTDAGDEVYQEAHNTLKRYMEDNDIFIATALGDKNKYWTKKDCFKVMGCEDEKYLEFPQVEAGTLAFRKTFENLNFVVEWLMWCKHPFILEDPLGFYADEESYFIEHRYDQSVLTNLVVKYNITPSKALFNYIKYNSYVP